MTKRKETLTRGFCLTVLAAAFVYGLVLPFMWGNDPLSETGTLSLLCEDRKAFFWLWGVLTSGSIIMNTRLLYRRYAYRNRLFDALCIIAFISVCCVALTLGHSIADWNPKRILHWVATGIYIVLTAAPILLFFIVNRRRHKSFKLFAIITVMIFLSFVFIFVFVGKSALMEMVPVALIELFLFVLNFIIPAKKPIELRTAK